jgi:2-polyprenyl-6-methoxyphenol hydroxylase-like FAD-dependent oxidoreductase
MILKLARREPIFRSFIALRTYATNQQRVNIIGATIEGLTTAISLQRFSKNPPSIRVLDTRENIDEKKGETLIITPRASQILKDLDLFNQVKQQGNSIGHYILLNSKNKVWMDRDWENKDYIAISYHRLHKILLDATKLTPVSFKYVIKDIVKEKDKYVIKSSRALGIPDLISDVLIGADGAKSNIRDRFFADAVVQDSHRNVDYNYMIINTPSEVDFEDRAFEYWGNTTRFAIVPINQRQLGIVSAFRNPEAGSERRGRSVVTTINQVHKELAKLDAPSYILKALKKIEDAGALPPYVEAIGKAPSDILVSEDVRDGVALIGEAAHTIDPIMWQTPRVALEDGYELAKCLADKQDLKAALQTYKNSRKAQVQSIDNASKYFTKQFTKQSHVFVDWYRSLKMMLGQKLVIKAKLRNLH